MHLSAGMENRKNRVSAVAKRSFHGGHARGAGPPSEETQLQIASVNLMRMVLPSDAIIHHSHNEGKRSKRDAGLAKAMGQLAGFADLIILWRGVCYFIEFKSATGRQEKEQAAFEENLAATGFPHYAIVRSIEVLVGVLKAWGLAKRSVGLNTFLMR